MKLTQPLKWHGGKGLMASKIVALMPKHTHYVEPFAGGLSVLLTKNPVDVSEVVNDLNGDLWNFWKVLQCEELFVRFRRLVEATPFSEQEWDGASEFTTDFSWTQYPVEAAVAFFIHCRQSLAGRMGSFTGITKTRTRRRMNNEVSAWLTAVEGLPLVHERLKRVMVLNRDALDVIRGQDGPDTLFYLDPPYLASTRTAPDVYAHEMTGEQHTDLCTVIRQCVGKVMLSGYPSELYRFQLEEAGWHRTDFDMANHASGGKDKRRMVECVWANFKAA